MINRVIHYFKTGPDLPVTADEQTIRSIYERKRWSVLLTLIIGFAFFYTCRLSLSVAKKPLIDAGILNAQQLGIIGSVLLYVYAVGKFVNGFLADRANIRKFMSIALLLSAIRKLVVWLNQHLFYFYHSVGIKRLVSIHRLRSERGLALPVVQQQGAGDTIWRLGWRS